eukprot:GGOE01060057.1.p1 GENE.GGOE01060057.1~~GGOE01060057.1.p1  ORF type:complete len:411 (+),score=100.63 GGOE01060057.1:53-1234(+)
MPHMSSTASAPTTPTACPVAVVLTTDMNTAITPVVGTIVNVQGSHTEARQYVEAIFRSSPVVSDTHGGHLKMREVLARGSWSVVYRVTEMVRRENFALKVIPQQGTHITSYYEDISKLSKLKHPNVIEMHSHFLFQEEDSPCPLLCIRLELCKFSLEQFIHDAWQKQRPIPTTDLCTYMTQMASALAYIHRQGMLHGDVCSANVLLAEGPTRDSLAVRLTNFGSSQRVVQPGAAPLTITGGNRTYVPPEWVNHTAPCRPLTPLETPLPSYDLWGLGCVLSEMATMTLMSDRLRHEDSLAADLTCLAALKEEMAKVHHGLLAGLCCGLLGVDPDERPSADSVPRHLPATPSQPSARPKHGDLGLLRPSHISSLLRPLGFLSRRQQHSWRHADVQ